MNQGLVTETPNYLIKRYLNSVAVDNFYSCTSVTSLLKEMHYYNQSSDTL